MEDRERTAQVVRHARDDGADAQAVRAQRRLVGEAAEPHAFAGDHRAQVEVVAVAGRACPAQGAAEPFAADFRSEEHTSELQSLMRISYAVFCLKKKKKTNDKITHKLMMRKHTITNQYQ